MTNLTNQPGYMLLLLQICFHLLLLCVTYNIYDTTINQTLALCTMPNLLLFLFRIPTRVSKYQDIPLVLVYILMYCAQLCCTITLCNVHNIIPLITHYTTYYYAATLFHSISLLFVSPSYSFSSFMEHTPHSSPNHISTPCSIWLSYIYTYHHQTIPTETYILLCSSYD